MGEGLRRSAFQKSLEGRRVQYAIHPAGQHLAIRRVYSVNGSCRQRSETALKEAYEGFYKTFSASCQTPLGAHCIERCIALPIEEANQGGFECCAVIEERIDGDRILQDARRMQYFASVDRLHGFLRCVNFNPSRAEESSDPDEFAATRQQIADLALKRLLVLSTTGVLHGQPRGAVRPSVHIRHIADRDIGGPQIFVAFRIAGVDADLFHARVGAQSLGAAGGGLRVMPAGGRAIHRMPILELVAVSLFPDVVDAKRSGAR